MMSQSNEKAGLSSDADVGIREDEVPSRIMGMKIPWFLAMFVVVIAASLLEAMPNEIISGFTVVMVLGGLLWWAGERVPVIKKYGLPTVLCILVPSIFLYLGWMPQQMAEVIDTFTSESGFINFYIAALISGSILGMPRQILLRAGARFAVPLVGMVAIVFVTIGGLASLLGFGFRDGILYVAGPILGGGIGAGAVPMSEMYALQMGGGSEDYLTQLIPAIVVANVLAIMIAGIYNGVSQNGKQLFVGFNGEGNLVKATGDPRDFQLGKRKNFGTFRMLSVGLALSGTLFIMGTIIAVFTPGIHSYAWTILLAAMIKIFGLLPQSFEEAVVVWYGFVARTLTAALLVGVGVAYLDIAELLGLFGDGTYFVLVVATVFLAAIMAGLLGRLVKFYFLESSVSIGLGMTDMGGTGDVAVLSAANRLELMPFLQISSRLGGAFVLLVLSFLIPLLA
ncbi:2-hydroxycarboxylate transporter family protein [Nesterenkonia sphaerica]|uniref:2-hydroxycarboxylate transporter family protein n=1 Tax=Nesterenkonia sphaerica TaxID=1804988 RepID=A0A5R9A510_9MICC|nr:2-hydroxycarboxylate transporter family protein [Nesterenkonia sphaerica]TLP72876.1 2-hydroxycarboxylate transporter family protein [Nesterenkonia sphaerica]